MIDQNQNFLVKVESFQGPLELLLSLIEKRKLLINNISLAKITDDYIEYLKKSEHKTIKENSHFILIASTLLLIKSKSLLPTLELTEEEENNIEDLEKRLKIYQRIKNAEKNILDLFLQAPSFFRENNLSTKPVFAPTPKTNLDSIKISILSVLNSFPKKEILPKKIVQKIISLEEMIGNLTKKIQQNLNLSFREFSNYGKEEKVNIVISFLAMLELVKEGIIEAQQSSQFEDIEMQTKIFETPNYS